MLLFECLDLCLCLCVCTFFFFFFLVIRNSNRYCSCTVRRQSYCSCIIYVVHTLFTGPTITSFKNIYILKMDPAKLFTIVFSFQQNKLYPDGFQKSLDKRLHILYYYLRGFPYLGTSFFCSKISLHPYVYAEIKLKDNSVKVQP